MTGYAVEYAPHAHEDLQSLSSDVAVRIAKKVLELGVNAHPRGDTIKWIYGRAQPTFRLRIGNYRAIFELDEATHRVYILRVVHRSQLDRALRDLM
ncbi:MAG: type II toxin-antitoxin system RelE/ParE family toxin [Planctomycetes bacterium]|nr:type II toxin-antitoxin system RelE/ParE family toxin [Planctomycetota bacterium]